ncbi:MAG: sigma-70 family RNA polymerase sigma factor, partial [Bacteroidota bacterium]|nr:sigma-70 family RNA polymerase sigma factor [Bacteroidota bacterium]
MEVLHETIEHRKPEADQQLLQDLYEKTFPSFARYAASMNASFEDARDVFHDAMVIYWEKSINASFTPNTSPEAYVVGIARNLWLKRFSRQRHHVSLEQTDEMFEVPANYFPDEHESRLLMFLERTGRKCMDLLHQFYFGNQSLRNIAKALGYRTEHSAAVQKFK